MKFKEFIGKSLVGKRMHLHCDCTARIDVIGTIVDYYVLAGELVVKVQTESGKIYDIGENHPSMIVEQLVATY